MQTEKSKANPPCVTQKPEPDRFKGCLLLRNLGISSLSGFFDALPSTRFHLPKIVVTASEPGASQVAAEQLSQREKGKRWSFQKNIPPRAVSARLQRARPRGSDAMAEVTCRYVERGASEARARVSRHRPRPRRRLEPSHARVDARDDT